MQEKENDTLLPSTSQEYPPQSIKFQVIKSFVDRAPYPRQDLQQVQHSNASTAVPNLQSKVIGTTVPTVPQNGKIGTYNFFADLVLGTPYRFRNSPMDFNAVLYLGVSDHLNPSKQSQYTTANRMTQSPSLKNLIFTFYDPVLPRNIPKHFQNPLTFICVPENP